MFERHSKSLFKSKQEIIIFNIFVNKIKQKLDPQSKILAKNTSWVFLANTIRTLLIFFRSIIIARALGAELFGIFAIILAFTGTIQEFFNLNIGTPLIKFGADYLSEKRTDKLVALIKLSTRYTLIAAIVSVVMVYIIMYLFYNTFLTIPNLQSFILVYSIAASFSFFDFISTSLLRLFYKFKFNSMLTIIMAVTEVAIIGLALYLFPDNFEMFFGSVVIGKILSSLICNGGAIFELRNELYLFIKSRQDLLKADVRKIWDFILTNSGSRTIKTLMDQGDVLLLGYLSNPVQVAFYSVAKKLSYSILAITDPITNSIYPQLSLLVSTKKYIEIKTMLKRITKLILYPSIGFVIIMYFLNEELIQLFYGTEYSGAGSAFFILLISSILGAIFFWALSLVLSLGLFRSRFFISIISLISGFILAYILTPKYGAVGVASGLLFAKFITLILSVFISKRKLAL